MILVNGLLCLDPDPTYQKTDLYRWLQLLEQAFKDGLQCGLS